MLFLVFVLFGDSNIFGYLAESFRHFFFFKLISRPENWQACRISIKLYVGLNKKVER